MKGEVTIRRATAGDAAAIAAFVVPVIREGRAYALDRDMSEADAIAYWFAPGKQVFVAHDGDCILGSYYLRANQGGGGAHVANAGYATDPAARGRGIAAAMCAHSLDQARALGFRAMQFNFVIASNVAAVHLWQRMGFAIVGRLPGAFDDPVAGEVDALVMYRAL